MSTNQYVQWPGRAAALAAALSLGAGGPARAVETLDGEQMHALLFGHTLTGSHPAVGAAWHAYVSPDGAIHIKGTRNEGAYEFFGQVTIEDDRWCEDWRIVDFQKKCRRIIRDGDTFSVVRDDGKVLSSFILRPGDPEGLGDVAPAAAGTTVTVEANEPAEPAAETTPPDNAPELVPAAVEPAAAETAPAAAPVEGGAMGNDAVSRMHQFGQSEDTIIELIDSSVTDFDLSPKAVAALRQAGVGTPVISAMLTAKLGKSGGTTALAASSTPAADEEQQAAAAPKPKSRIDDGVQRAPASAEVAVAEAAPEQAGPAQGAPEEVAPAAAGVEVAPEQAEAPAPSVDDSVALAAPAIAMPTGQGLYAMMADAPVEIPVTTVEVTVGLRMAGSEKHNSAVDGFGSTPPAVLASAPLSFIVKDGEVDPRGLRLSQLGYMVERRADQFNLLGIEPAYFASVYGHAPEENLPVGLWRPKTVIDMLVEPIEGEPGMYRLTPTEPLAPGRYALHQTGAVHPYDEVFLAETGYRAQAYYFAIGEL